MNHAVAGQDLFRNNQDRARFVHDLYEFNDARPVNNLTYRFDIKGLRNPYFPEDMREKIVSIHGWCLMRDHYHLLLSEEVENGMSLFMRKMNVGYANSFNEKYGRRGTLFQGRTKKILIEREAHFNYILHYVHLNPLDYLEGAKEWRERNHQGILDATQALEYLNTYRWSSYLDYTGKRNFPSILSMSIFKDVLGDYAGALAEYLEDAEADLASLQLLEY